MKGSCYEVLCIFAVLLAALVIGTGCEHAAGSPIDPDKNIASARADEPVAAEADTDAYLVALLDLFERDEMQAALHELSTDTFAAVANTVRQGSPVFYTSNDETGLGIYHIDGSVYTYYGQYQDTRRQGQGLWAVYGPSAFEPEVYLDISVGQWDNDRPNGSFTVYRNRWTDQKPDDYFAVETLKVRWWTACGTAR